MAIDMYLTAQSVTRKNRILNCGSVVGTKGARILCKFRLLLPLRYNIIIYGRLENDIFDHLSYYDYIVKAQ
jgi:hypothetical protein